MCIMEHFKIGQAWVGEARGEAPPLLCAIGAIDRIETEGGEPYQVLSLRISPHPKAREAGWTVIGHVPITDKAFAESGLTLAPEPVALGADFDHGYKTWRDKFDAGEAGAFTLLVHQVYSAVVSFAAERAAE